jgi:translation elongation factor EF-1alpha
MQIKLIHCIKVSVEVMTLYSDDYETTQAECGENVKAKLKGIEEDVCIELNLCGSFVHQHSCSV